MSVSPSMAQPWPWNCMGHCPPTFLPWFTGTCAASYGGAQFNICWGFSFDWLKKKISKIFKVEDQKACMLCDPVVSPCQAPCIMCSERPGCSAHSPALQSPPVMHPTFPVQKMCIRSVLLSKCYSLRSE